VRDHIVANSEKVFPASRILEMNPDTVFVPEMSVFREEKEYRD
jgi:hypothetical protein